MRISKHIHSCLLIEESDTKILVDPGGYSFGEDGEKPESFTGLSAIFITHNHPDHADPKALKIILEQNPGAKVYGNSDTKDLLAKEGVPVEVFEDGEKQVGAISVAAYLVHHEKHLGIEPKNTAYIFNKVMLVTGDSYDGRLSQFKNIPILATPIMAPWANQLQTAEFVKLIAPKIFLPIHDGFVKESAQQWATTAFKAYLTDFDIEVRALGPNEALEA